MQALSILENMLAMFGSLGVDVLSNFKCISVCTLYDYQSVLASGNEWIWKMIVAFGIAVITFAVGSVQFCKKDLPL